MRIRSVTVLAALSVLALTGCTSMPVPHPTASTTARDAASASPSAVADLYGPDAVTLSQFVRTYPQFTPAELRGVSFLLEEAATGPREFPLPAEAEDAESLVLVIFCDADSPYEIDVMKDAEVVDRTWGAACPRSGIVLYTTAPLTGPSEGLSVRARVDDGVAYRLSVAAHATP